MKRLREGRVSPASEEMAPLLPAGSFSFLVSDSNGRWRRMLSVVMWRKQVFFP